MALSTPSAQRRTALRITPAYVLLAGTWILLSDALLARVAGEVATMAYFSLAKGAAFVLVTGLILYLALARGTQPAAAPQATERRSWLRRPLHVFVLPGLALLGAIVLFLQHAAVDGAETARVQAMLFGALLLALTLFAGVGAAALWRQQAAIWSLRERALRAERDALGEHLNLLSRNANDIVLLLDAGGRVVRANERALEAYGRRSLGGTSGAELRPRAAAGGFAEAYARVLREGSAIYETTHVRADGRELPVEISARRIDTHEGPFLQATIRDLTERRNAERALAESEARFRAMVEQSISGIYVIQDGRFAYVNPRFAEIFGYGAPEEMVGRAPQEFVAPRDRALVNTNIARRLAGEVRSLAYTFAGLRKDGSEVEVGVHGSVATFAGRPAVIGALQDISERARAERERQNALEELNATATRLAKVNRALRTVSAGNETLVRSTDEPALLRSMCRVIVEAGGYRFAAVGYVQPGPGRPIAPQASAGIPFEELREIPMPRADPGHRLAPSASAIAKGAPQLHLDPAGDPQFAPWRELIVRYELASAVSMPLRASVHSPPYGVLVIGASDRDAFDSEAIKLLEELANDLAFGIGNLRVREDQRASAVALRKSLEDTILAIAATMEMRDPYTAGHERRVAELAASIARELGLAEPAIEGIRFGAMIHDLGKIKIPAEILVKPTRLAPIEYELSKQHAQAGYDILKCIDFPWPVAQMVLQHHERLDGSGYPNGLKGDALIREARILAIADVVEAMSSHRPYRPGLGLDTALAEIERGRGAQYDAHAVDACLRLFREKGYTLPA